MTWEWATFAATVIIQALAWAFAYGKLSKATVDNTSDISTMKQVQEVHWTEINGLKVRISVAEAYQQGLKDGTSHMRTHSVRDNG